ncbi:C-terminal binding protein [Microbacterium sp.]|uniref:C-terminal binding protein n=1 Tax=Microbacterium sp. TaxID=51671 RepID=UPI003A8BE0DB
MSAPATTPVIVVTDQSFGGTPHAAAIAVRNGAALRSHQVRAEAETVAAVRGADVVLVQYAPVTAAVLDAINPGGCVIRYGIGYDNIDVTAAHARGIRVATVPDYGVDTVADHAVALIYAAGRRIVQYDRLLRASRGAVGPDAAGVFDEFAATTVGLVGTGRIGRAIAHRLAASGVRLIAYDPYADPAVTPAELLPLDDVLAAVDILSLHAPATAETHHLIRAETLARMKPDAVLVNTARGSLVDTEALADALVDGRLGGAALDVVDPEPLPPDSRLWDAPNLLMTPHVAFYSRQSLERLERLAAEEAERALRSEPLRSEITAP